jgi:tryptophan synthase alpha chain
MTYLNPVHNYGYENFFAQCSICGISAVIIPDLPFEEQGEIEEFAGKHDVNIITLIAPTSQQRLKAISENAKGFIYLVSSMGVTGVRNNITTDIKGIVESIRKYTSTPVAVGFGIHSPEQAKKISADSDGVIVGSAIVKIIEEHGDCAHEPLRDYIKAMKCCMGTDNTHD